MKDYREILNELIEETTNIDTIDINDIPDIDLYMDQVTTFMDDKLNCFKRYPSDKVLTKTMINNYAKAKVFPPPIKKKYTKNHLMLLIIIYHLKSILSINDINKLLKPITEEWKVNESSQILEIVYKNFVLLQKNNMENVLSELTGKYELINHKPIELSLENNEQVKYILTVLLLAIQSNTEKRMVEKFIDKYF